MDPSGSMNSRRPDWFRVDVGITQNPKLQRLRAARRHDALWLWLDGLGYSVEHLTDGWIPPWLPTSRGFKARDGAALVEVGLWHVLEVADMGGWLVHDFLAYQTSKDQWETELRERQHRARRAARARWDGAR